MGIEPMVRVLQTLALPLGDVAGCMSLRRNHTRTKPICQSSAGHFGRGTLVLSTIWYRGSARRRLPRVATATAGPMRLSHR